jgi:hypothetical protein
VAAGFSYPSATEMKSWAADVGIRLDESEAARERRRLRWAVQVFTKSILVAVLLSVGCALLALRAEGSNFWILYVTAVAIPLIATFEFRGLLASRWPELAARYYLTAVLDRLHRWGTASTAADLRYLRTVVPPLEDVLLGAALTRRAAGSQQARSAIRLRLTAVLLVLGRAEERLMDLDGDEGRAEARRLRPSLGRLLIAVQRGAYTALPQPEGEQAEAAEEAEKKGLGSKVKDKLADHALGLVGGALAAVLVPMLHGLVQA